jgi:hypothetical protein
MKPSFKHWLDKQQQEEEEGWKEEGGYVSLNMCARGFMPGHWKLLMLSFPLKGGGRWKITQQV